MWDSRCIHCNTPALVYKDKTNQSEFLRVVTYICMSPSSMFVPNPNEYKNLEEYRQLREQFVRDGITCPHWPLQLDGASMYYKRNLLKKKEHFIKISIL